jgi:hypothetical protein
MPTILYISGYAAIFSHQQSAPCMPCLAGEWKKMGVWETDYPIMPECVRTVT